MAQAVLPQQSYTYENIHDATLELPDGTFTMNNLDPMIRNAFLKLKAFNKVQSTVAKTVIHTDSSIVVNAPTGSGKTVILELAMVKLAQQAKDSSFRILYLAPTRSLCAEKFQDWKVRFAPLGISCIQFDGDNAVEDVSKLSNHRLILSTPEKWEVFTRHWDDQNVASVLRPIRLLLIDEIQVINDTERGSNLELVLSRMKYIDARLCRDHPNIDDVPVSIRFIAVSACIPNVADFAQWLRNDRNVIPFTFDDTNRTTKIERHVLSFPCVSNPYKFELNLNYKLPAIIDQFSRQKPTLVFCTSRKSVESTAKFLARSNIKRSIPAGSILNELANNLANRNLQECVSKGVAYHHAGLLHNDRIQIENHFRAGHLTVLCCTSTLCMGVNLPAYLVVVKSTFNYSGKDYTDNYILQMIGRAGRAEYNEDGVAVILTTDVNLTRYQKIVTESIPIESQLRQKLPELLNSEIAHGIIYDQPAVMEWIKSTFFYVRARLNPAHYQLTGGRLVDEEIEKLCNDTIESLEANELIVKQRSNTIVSSACGRLMARNQLSFQTMKLLQQDMKGKESLDEMLVLITRANEFSEFKCRQGEKKILNTLNGPTISASYCDGGDDSTGGVRFRWPRRISTTGAKVYCLVQAVFGNLTINDHGLHQEAAKIVTLGARIARFVVGLLTANRDHFESGSFRALVSVTTLLQCFQTKLWENSPFLTKQLGQIGPRLARHLADRGKITFQAVRNSDPREIECILKKQPPLGNDIVNFVSGLPEFAIELKRTLGDPQSFTCTVVQKNVDYDPEISVSFSVLVGDSANKVLLHLDSCTMENIPVMGCTWPLSVKDCSVESLSAYLICQNWTGLDCTHTLWLVEQPNIIKHRQTAITNFFPNTSANESALSVEKLVLPSALELSRMRSNVSKTNEPSNGVEHSFLDVSRYATYNSKQTNFRDRIANHTKLFGGSNNSINYEQINFDKPIRSILKPASSALPDKPQTFAPLNISECLTIGNNQNLLQRPDKPSTVELLFRNDELQYMFQPEKFTLNFTLCSPVDDIVDCFKRYNIFMADRQTFLTPLPEKQYPAKVDIVAQKKKNFDLGSACDVFCSDDE
ncbi:probable ATP-dependent DNA helicase HFM1 [Anopheles marshallii]|uniref:probable ATP-dependent DNA helicase HFM1 n=1 Tax=Anopheles marshallii TaxID=1521116 RepID=UPI00237BE87E|nr:probable ATP-dependent DNA helicase HFM1 [Anopheles marshallii]